MLHIHQLEMKGKNHTTVNENDEEEKEMEEIRKQKRTSEEVEEGAEEEVGTKIEESLLDQAIRILKETWEYDDQYCIPFGWNMKPHYMAEVCATIKAVFKVGHNNGNVCFFQNIYSYVREVEPIEDREAIEKEMGRHYKESELLSEEKIKKAVEFHNLTKEEKYGILCGLTDMTDWSETLKKTINELCEITQMPKVLLLSILVSSSPNIAWSLYEQSMRMNL